jgi:hypothetical protein
VPNSCVFTIHEFCADLNYKKFITLYTLNNIYTQIHTHTHMDLVFIIPVLTIVLLSIYRFVEFKITNEFKPVKFYIQESVLIFSCSLLSNVIF